MWQEQRTDRKSQQNMKNIPPLTEFIYTLMHSCSSEIKARQ